MRMSKGKGRGAKAPDAGAGAFGEHSGHQHEEQQEQRDVLVDDPIEDSDSDRDDHWSPAIARKIYREETTVLFPGPPPGVGLDRRTEMNTLLSVWAGMLTSATDSAQVDFVASALVSRLQENKNWLGTPEFRDHVVACMAICQIRLQGAAGELRISINALLLTLLILLREVEVWCRGADVAQITSQSHETLLAHLLATVLHQVEAFQGFDAASSLATELGISRASSQVLLATRYFGRKCPPFVISVFAAAKVIPETSLQLDLDLSDAFTTFVGRIIALPLVSFTEPSPTLMSRGLNCPTMRRLLKTKTRGGGGPPLKRHELTSLSSEGQRRERDNRSRDAAATPDVELLSPDAALDPSSDESGDEDGGDSRGERRPRRVRQKLNHNANGRTHLRACLEDLLDQKNRAVEENSISEEKLAELNGFIAEATSDLAACTD